MKRLMFVCLYLLSSCASQEPIVQPSWPSAPSALFEPAEKLKPLGDDQHRLSDLIENANINYSQYYLLKEKYEAWQNWYDTQKKIWNGIK
jgi:hypothetical protein